MPEDNNIDSKRELVLRGVRQNNLKDIDLDIPLGKSVIVTGPSGSGKSSLAFETIYAEGQRRYMQSLSTYARQFLERFKAPLVEKLINIPPSIALEQINPVRNSRATVGTTTEINDYLRLLFEKVGKEYCSKCHLPKEQKTPHDIYEFIKQKYSGKGLLICAHTKPKETPHDFLSELLRTGFTRVLVQSEAVLVEDLLKKKKLPKSFVVIVDRIKVTADENKDEQKRFIEAIHNALGMGDNEVNLYQGETKVFELAENFSRWARCPKCHETASPKSAISFSFNSPLGACETCKGFGNTLEIDEDLIVPNSSLSILKGAIDPFTKPSLRNWQKKLLEFCHTQRIDETLPYKELSKKHREMIFNGDKKFRGVRGVFKLLEEEKYKMRIRVFLSRYTSPFTCKACEGQRLNNDSLRVKVADQSIAQVSSMTISQLRSFFSDLSLNAKEKKIAKDILAQLDRRLDTLETVGLGYLTLSRLTKSLSGGEYQRILLGTQLSQGLTDTLYVLDEPSIGLHPKDTQQLLKVLNKLHQLGNSLLLVEHDPEVIEWGQYIIDMGPGSGMRGGEVIFSGSRELFLKADSTTSRAVKDWRNECRHSLLRPLSEPKGNFIELRGAKSNNLKNVDIDIPLKCIVAVTGVSGSGKSTLIVDTLFQALSKILNGTSDKIGKFSSISGFENLSSVELVDQSPVGKTSRSNPITFIKGYDEIRALFSQTPEAIKQGFSPGSFSFNVAGGRCDTCEGEGRVKVDMVFMEDVWVPCQDCDEKRFKRSVLAVRYRGKNIDDVLRMTIDEAYEFFKGIPSLRTKLSLLVDVGLGYLQLGQPGFSLSGGESQRLKIARELTQTMSKGGSTLFILDEPTTGLHFNEVVRLTHVLRRLISSGHSVIVIEHNLQLICAADYIIDLGPDGGEGGGNIVATGTPKAVAQKKLLHTSRYLSELL
ncbi:MAG: excinuclease ABC subunit A [Proteobacteria bacterium]|nr:excinuclease ABC subunit A [Pseudomonadota bacterium]